MADTNTTASSTRIDIGLSKEDQARIEALRKVRVEKETKSIKDRFAKLNELVASFSKIKLKEKVNFFQLLAVMINAGMPIIRSLYVLSEQVENPRFAKIIYSLAKRMEEGKSLSEAMQTHSKLFSESERGMVASGEATGNLNDILKNIASQAEKGAMIIGKVKGAMIYPAAIMVIMVAALFLLLTLVVPQITSVFAESGQELPKSTQILIWASDFAIHSWYIILAIAVALFAAVYMFSKSDTGKYSLNFGILFVPVFGKIIKKVMIARFARMLALLLDAGIPIVKSLEINANAVGNEVYKKRINYAAQDVTQGIPLGENLTDSSWLFPPMVASMILVGEKTANITEVATKIAEYYESEVDTAVSSLSRLMEPVILVVMGLTVGFLVSAIMQPIIGLSDLTSVL
ncbi:type II secretion system F family protein [Patescibacteria group bacterium]|nr:type II secretion system F family protein [Patescibacteria group bacterium]